MGKLDYILVRMKQDSRNVRFNDLCQVCEKYFGKPRKGAGSHRIYITPWPKDPRIDIQDDKGRAKTYQARQVLLAIEKLEVGYGPEK